MDPMGQNIGDTTMLDEYHEIGTTQDKSMNAMDPNWDNSLQV
jgi:hypothetical protein